MNDTHKVPLWFRLHGLSHASKTWTNLIIKQKWTYPTFILRKWGFSSFQKLFPYQTMKISKLHSEHFRFQLENWLRLPLMHIQRSTSLIPVRVRHQTNSDGNSSSLVWKKSWVFIEKKSRNSKSGVVWSFAWGSDSVLTAVSLNHNRYAPKFPMEI